MQSLASCEPSPVLPDKAVALTTPAATSIQNSRNATDKLHTINQPIDNPHKSTESTLVEKETTMLKIGVESACSSSEFQERRRTNEDS